jgi:hypothetical protein
MRAIRASELGAFLYCRRAWWYQQQGVTPQNETEISAGSLYHRQHGQRVLVAGLLRFAGWLMLLVALAVAAIALTIQLLP